MINPQGLQKKIKGCHLSPSVVQRRHSLSKLCAGLYEFLNIFWYQRTSAQERRSSSSAAMLGYQLAS